MDFVQARKVFRGNRCKKPNSTECQQNAEASASETENDAFHQCRLKEAHSSRAECGSNGVVPLARGGARQLQAGKIHTGNQQEAEDRGEKQPERLADIACHLL